MPYLQYDVDAKKQVPKVARSAGMSTAEVGWGLLELWEHAWTADTDVVGEVVLTGCIGPSEQLRTALVAFGFLERLEDGQWRIKGTDRYSKADEARSRGGKAAAGNLIPGARHKAKPRTESLGSPSAAAESQPRASRENVSAAHRVNREPRTENRETTTPPTPSKQMPHRTPLVERVAEVFKAERGADYSPSFADEQAGRALLGKGPEDEVLRRWGIGLRARYPACNGLPDLLRNWNAYATEAANGPPSGARPVALVRALDAEKCAHEGCQRPPERDSYGVPMCGPHADESTALHRGAAP
jgi:hypothetical protein